jgi:para-aminobenzoate synthetase/4-amino-4-deoxychorismate lyase
MDSRPKTNDQLQATTYHQPASQGFSLLETMRLEEGTVVRLDRHMARLAGSAHRFGFTCEEARIRSAIAATAQAHPSGQWRVRLLVARDGEPTIECTPYTADGRTWRVAFAATAVDSWDPFLANKTTHREIYDAARRARPDVDDVLLSNERGEITEATIANVVAEIDGVRYTPPLACGLLGGVFRGELVASGDVHERVLTRADITNASHLWLINSLREWIKASVV